MSSEDQEYCPDCDGPKKIEGSVWFYDQGRVAFNDKKDSYYTRVKAVEPAGVTLTA